MKDKNDLDRLRDFKKSSGWSYHRLSNHIGVHYQTVISWFLGSRSPSLLASEKLRKFLRSIEKLEAQGDLKR